jgi:DNA-binding response OmpR family regulator
MTTRIVLIEDDPDVAELVEALLTDVGHQVDVRTHLADSAIDDEVHLVITDLVTVRNHEVTAAREWIARVRVAFPKAAVILSSAHQLFSAAGAPALGADAVVTKPFDIGEFTEIVESLLGD